SLSGELLSLPDSPRQGSFRSWLAGGRNIQPPASSAIGPAPHDQPRTKRAKPASLSLRALQGPHQHAHLIQRFLVFGLPIRVGDDAAAAPAGYGAVLDQQAADGDGAVHLATHVEIKHRAAVEA